ncbi:alpha-tocopherol transfer protein-like [Stegodyphus dumicola]|uniref:alpha-tocopherol transfer protein-like n=1 Tax=Stegodyphus dumicola TaxID=202533 RepID=UPI0015B34A21|nr:alpha-tocopherol transfer protein-like [Stegodyphus dumicola]
MEFLPYHLDGLTPELIKKAKIELGETSDVRKQALIFFKQLIENEPNFYPFMDDTFFLMFLRCKKYDVQKAFNSFLNFYRFKKKYSGIFTDFLPSDLRKVMSMNSFKDSELRTKDGGIVGILLLGNHKWEQASIEDIVATILHIGLITYRREATQISGGRIIIDFRNVTWHQFLTCASPTMLGLVFSSVENCWPYRLKAIHLVNEPKAFSLFFSMLKFAMPKKVQERFHMHGNDLDGLHKYIPTEMLPEELDGTAGPMDNTEYYKYILSHEDLLKEMNKCGFKSEK